MCSKKSNDRGLVFSTEQGRICPACKKTSAACCCGKSAPVAPPDGIFRIRLEAKGRNGKGVTLVTGLLHDQESLIMVRELKKKCGCGGSIKAQGVEIQGDHPDTLTAELAAQGYTVKRTGG